MPRLIFLFTILSFFVSCQTKPSQAEVNLTTDELIYNVLNEVVKQEKSFIDIPNEVNQLLDSMQKHVEFHPDEDVRIRTKSFAILLSELIIGDEQRHPENSAALGLLMMQLIDVINTWYLYAPQTENNLMTMTQNIIRTNGEHHDYFMDIDVICYSDTQMVVIYFPEYATGWPQIGFKSGTERALLFPNKNIINAQERTDTTSLAVMYDERLIDAMLTNDVMYIGYIADDDQAIDDKERFHTCTLGLKKFHQQYNGYLKTSKE